MLNWLVHERGIEPDIPVIDKSSRIDGTFSRDDFAYDHKRDCYIRPADAPTTGATATTHPRRRDHFKPDFFNGIGQERALGRATSAPSPGVSTDAFVLKTIHLRLAIAATTRKNPADVRAQ